MQRMVLFYTIQAQECYTMLALLLVNVCVNLLNCFSLVSQPTKCAKLNLRKCSIIIIQRYPVSQESLGTAVKYHWCSWLQGIHGKHHGTPQKHHHRLIKDWLFIHHHQNFHQELQKSVWYLIKWYIKCIRYCWKVFQTLHLLQNHLGQVHTDDIN